MDVITYRKNYREYKAELDNELQKTAEGFVRIGYLLKVARDTNVLAESGYKTVAEFAQAEYSLDKTQVSHFISINDKFSENGYSDRLQVNYQGFGYAKLTLMLQLPDAVNEVLTPSYSKAEIQSIKEEIDEEKKVSDIEVCLEASEAHTGEGNLVERIVKQLLHDEPGTFGELHREAFGCSVNMQHFQRIMAPAGEKTYSVRLSGVGRVLLILNDAAENRAVNSRTGEFEEVTWQQLRETVEKFTGFKECTGKTAQERWLELFNEPYPHGEPSKPEKTEVAPEQPAKQEKKETRKESKVKKAKNDGVKKPTKPAIEEAKPEADEQVPGQTDIEKDFPEYMPEQKVDSAELMSDGRAWNTTDSQPQNGANPHKDKMRELVRGLADTIEKEMWGTALVKVHELRNMIEQAAGEGGHNE